MKWIQMVVLATMVSSSLAATENPAPRAATSDDPAGWFTPEQATAKLLILGTFHFKDSGRDTYKPEVDIDILSATRQQELAAILDRLEEFAPTKILIEVKAERQAEWDQRYQQYLAGELDLGANEIYQIAFQLGKRLEQERLFGVDATGRRYEDLPDTEEYAEEHGQAFPTADVWDQRFMEAYRVEDHAKAKRTLSEHLLLLNSDEQLRFSHGHYVLSYLALGTEDEYPAADSLTGWWYNRNLRIYSNILRVMEPGDRLLLLIGAGHVPIIQHAADASPEIDLIDLSEVLR